MYLTIFYTSVVLTIFYIISLAIYRLYLSPIAHIPGPPLAALSWWYEFYYDIVHYGKYIFKIRDLHAQYGPIIRISPSEVHVADPEFFDTLYAASNTNRKDRWIRFAHSLGLPRSSLGAVEHNLHRNRRAAMSPFFSKQNVRKLQPLIQERAGTLVSVLKRLADNGEVVAVNLAFSAFSNDVVMQYSFGRHDHRVEADGFDPTFHHTSFKAGYMIGYSRSMPWILDTLIALPESVAMAISLEAASSIVLKRERINQVDAIRGESRGKANVSGENDTVFHTLLASDLPSSEKTSQRLAEEAVLLVGAGTHTTSWTLTVATYHLISQPSAMRKLKAELEAAIPNSAVFPPLLELEKLPFMTAVIKEALRLAFGTSSRIPRVAIDKPMEYHGTKIPTGVPVSMTIPLIHLNPEIFPDPEGFHPERWLEADSSVLERYLVPFSKGPRGCVGINLAWAELYICLSAVFRVFGSTEVRGAGDVGVMELYETDYGDIKMTRDGFFPVPKEGSKGVRLKVSN